MIEREAVGARGAVTLLRIRHGAVNALDIELVEALTDELTAAAGRAGAVVLTGVDRTFSAGVDLRRLAAESTGYFEEFLPALDELFRTAFTLPAPLVAAVNGHAIAGGAILAAAADTVVMGSGPGRISVPELQAGVPLPPVAFETLRHRVGNRGAQTLLHTTRPCDSRAAAALGLVDELVEDDVLARAVDIADSLAALTPLDAYAMTKAQLRGPAVDRIAAARFADVAELWGRRYADGSIGRFAAAATAGSTRS